MLEWLDWQSSWHLWLNQGGSQWVLLGVALLVFMESACILTPFLPGDSLLVATSLMFVQYRLMIWPLFIIVFCVTVLGYEINFAIAKAWMRFLHRRHSPWVTRLNRRIEHTKYLYSRFGVAMVIMARFTPVVRTYMPCFLGVVGMSAIQFRRLNILGALIWVFSLVVLPYYLGRISWVNGHMNLIILFVLGVSVIPLVIGGISVLRQVWFGKKDVKFNKRI